MERSGALGRLVLAEASTKWYRTMGAAADPAAIGVAGHAAQIADLLAAIEEGREPAVDGQAGRDALEIVCAVYESARTRQPVCIGRGDDPP